MDIESLLLPKQSFNGIWASASLLHISKSTIPHVFSQIHSLLKEEGIFYLSVKKGSGEALIPDHRYGGVEKFWVYYEERELVSLLEGSGFNVISMATGEIRSNYQTHPFIRVFSKKEPR